MVAKGEGFVFTEIFVLDVVSVEEVTVHEIELKEDTVRELGLEKEVAVETVAQLEVFKGAESVG